MRRLIEVTDNWQGAVLLVLFKTTKKNDNEFCGRWELGVRFKRTFWKVLENRCQEV